MPHPQKHLPGIIQLLPYRTKIWRTIFSADTIYSADKIFGTKANIRHFCPNFVLKKCNLADKNSADKSFRRTKFSAPYKIFGNFVRRICFKKTFAKFLIRLDCCFFNGFSVTRKYAGKKNSADKNFGGQKFSADKIFGTSSNFRQFCPPNFCPIRYLFRRDGNQDKQKILMK